MGRHLRIEHQTISRVAGKHLFVMVGYPGTGKSTIAKNIFRNLDQGKFLNRDILRIGRGVRAMANNAPDTLQIDKILFQAAREELQYYQVVILDATFREFEKRKKVYEIAEAENCQVTLIHCVSSDEVVLRRLRYQKERKDKIFRKELSAVLNYYKSNFEPLTDDAKYANILVADTENEETTIESALCPPTEYLYELRDLINRSYKFVREQYAESQNGRVSEAALQRNGQATNGTAPNQRTSAKARTDLTEPDLNSTK